MIETAAPLCVTVAFQIWVIDCEPGHEYDTFQPFAAVVPSLVTVTPSWKPPLHALVTVHVTEQPPGLPVALAEGEAECDGDVDGDGDVLGEAEAECEGDADTDALADGDGDPLGGVPLPLVSTTTDSAGIDSELPVKLPVAMLGLAAL